MIIAESDLVEALRNVVRFHAYDLSKPPPSAVRIAVLDRSGPARITIDIQLDAAVATSPPPAPAEGVAYWHSPDHQSWHWKGEDWVFTPTQAAIVRALWEANRAGRGGLTAQEALAAAGSASSLRRLDNHFRKNGVTHPAIGKLIVKCERGLYRLAVGSEGGAS